MNRQREDHLGLQDPLLPLLDRLALVEQWLDSPFAQEHREKAHGFRRRELAADARAWTCATIAYSVSKRPQNGEEITYRC